MDKIVAEFFQAIGVKDTNIVTMQCEKTGQKAQASITLASIIEKIKILHNFQTHPVTSEIEKVEQKSQSTVDKVCSHYCKYTLGTNKCSSSMLTLGDFKV